MKRVKKNQVIITALAIMIAVAGYINYAGNISDIISVSSKSGSKLSIHQQMIQYLQRKNQMMRVLKNRGVLYLHQDRACLQV